MSTENANQQAVAAALSELSVLMGLDAADAWIQVPLSLLRDLGVSAHTADYALTTADIGKIHTNTGAAGTVTLALPAATVGMHFRGLVRAAQALRFDPQSGEVIANNTVNSADGGAGKYIGTNTAAIGASIHLVCQVAGRWDILNSRGTWTLEA